MALKTGKGGFRGPIFGPPGPARGRPGPPARGVPGPPSRGVQKGGIFDPSGDPQKGPFLTPLGPPKMGSFLAPRRGVPGPPGRGSRDPPGPGPGPPGRGVPDPPGPGPGPPMAMRPTPPRAYYRLPGGDPQEAHLLSQVRDNQSGSSRAAAHGASMCKVRDEHLCAIPFAGIGVDSDSWER